MSQLSDRLRLAREKSGLSVRKAAAKAGVATSTWSDWETGKVVPHGSNRMKAALALDVSSEWLRTGMNTTTTRGSEWITLPPRPPVSASEASPAVDLATLDQAELAIPETIARVRPFLIAVDGYLRLLHQELPLIRRINLASSLMDYCESEGRDTPEGLSLEELHSALSKEVFG
jgi:transcriptional regulator with XRE-family HTH domain